MSAWVYGIATAVMGVGGYLGYLMFEAKARPITPRSAPEIPVDELPLTTFAEELRAIDVPAPPNYASGEHPPIVDEEPAPVEEEPPTGPAEPAPPSDDPPAAPWWTLPGDVHHARHSIDDEPTPIFRELGVCPKYADFDLDLSPTHAWKTAERADLRAALQMSAEEAA